MADEHGDKTEAPTPKRQKEARENGELLRSREFATALVILVGVGWMAVAGPSLVAALKEMLAASFTFGRDDVENFEPARVLYETAWRLAPSIGSLLAVAMAAAILSQAGLGSLNFNGGLMAPKWNRVDPGAGLKRIFGSQGWMELGKSLLKVVLLGAIGYWALSGASKRMLGLAASDVNVAVGTLGGDLIAILIAMAGGLVLIAAIDVPG